MISINNLKYLSS